MSTRLTTTEQDEITRLWRHHAPLVSRFLRSRICDAVAEDLMSAVFEAALLQVQRHGSERVTAAWFITVAKRRLVDHHRSTERSRVRQDRLVSDCLIGYQEPVDAPLDPTGVRSALAQLGQRHRVALEIRYLRGHSVGEVAAHMGVSYRAAESVLARARRDFRAVYAEDQEVLDLSTMYEFA